VYETAKVASMKPRCGRKKNCTPRLACASLSACGSVGMSDALAGAVPVNWRVAWLTKMVDCTSLSDAARSGVR
jgi:hypothetical protein